jgi:hypothetical protein
MKRIELRSPTDGVSHQSAMVSPWSLSPTCAAAHSVCIPRNFAECPLPASPRVSTCAGVLCAGDRRHVLPSHPGGRLRTRTRVRRGIAHRLLAALMCGRLESLCPFAWGDQYPATESPPGPHARGSRPQLISPRQTSRLCDSLSCACGVCRRCRVDRVRTPRASCNRLLSVQERTRTAPVLRVRTKAVSAPC